jgi:stress response protein SCP2
VLPAGQHGFPILHEDDRVTLLQSGSNAPLPGLPVKLTLSWSNNLPEGLDIDASLYLLGENGKVADDSAMVFYGQPSASDGSAALTSSDRSGAVFSLRALSSSVAKAAITLVVDDTVGRGRGFAEAGSLTLKVSGPDGEHSYAFDGTATSFKAVVMAEIYQRNGETKIRALGQGFDGGLKPLSEHFGVVVEDEPPAAAPKPPGRVSLEKKIVSLEKKRPGMVSLLKKADTAVAKAGLSGLVAKVALCLDISGSMRKLYRSGAVDKLVERILALGYRFDDDGEIDVFLFGKRAHSYGSVGPEEVDGFSQRMLDKVGLEPDTMYGLVMETIRAHYRSQSDFGRIPIFVMFVTDGGTSDVRRTETQMMQASSEAIFWKFMAIGEMPKKTSNPKKSSRLPKGFDFLAYLDDMEGRAIDNADFFAVEDPSDPSEEELYGMLLEEFPQWLEGARKAGILKA